MCPGIPARVGRFIVPFPRRRVQGPNLGYGLEVRTGPAQALRQMPSERQLLIVVSAIASIVFGGCACSDSDHSARTTQFVIAAYRGDTTELSRLLDSGAAVNARYLRGAEAFAADHLFMLVCTQSWTALHAAALKGRVEIIQLLLDRGANMEASDEFGGTPLLYACGTPIHPGGDENAAKTLIVRGANVNARYLATGPPLIAGSSALHCAAASGKTGVVQALIAAGAKVNAVDQLGRTPLDVAVEYDELAAAKVLRDAGGRHLNLMLPPPGLRV